MICQVRVSYNSLIANRSAAPRDHSAGFADGAAPSIRAMGRSRFDGAPPPLREEPPLPTQPPFTAFVVNLSFDSDEAAVRAFFEPMNPISVRLVSGHDGRPRGYGYVEFQTLDELKDALTFTGKPLDNRNVRVSVAEPSSRAARSAAADDATQWRRSTPLPSSDTRRGPFGGFDGPSGFDNMSISSDGARTGFGGKFAPSNDMPRRRGPMEPIEPSAGDVASDWRTGKPVTSKSSRFGFGDHEGGAAGRGGFGQRYDDADFSTWRSKKSSADGEVAPLPERRKLELKPRSAAASSNEASQSTSSKPNPFGAAKPVDVNERQRQIDEKIREQDRVRREELMKEDERKKSKGFFGKPRASEAWSENTPDKITSGDAQSKNEESAS